MSNSHFTSNVVGHVGINVASVTATLLAVGSAVSAPITTVTSYIKLGSTYIFQGGSNAEASIIAEASALVGLTRAGSLYMSSKGALWLFLANSNASPVNVS